RFSVRYVPGNPTGLPGRYEAYDEHPSMTAVGILTRLFAQNDRKDAALVGAQLLGKDLPDAKAMKVDYNYWYLGSLALLGYDGPDSALSKQWDAALRKAVLTLQKRKPGGCIDGSWDPASKWGT